MLNVECWFTLEFTVNYCVCFLFAVQQEQPWDGRHGEGEQRWAAVAEAMRSQHGYANVEGRTCRDHYVYLKATHKKLDRQQRALSGNDDEEVPANGAVLSQVIALEDEANVLFCLFVLSALALC